MENIMQPQQCICDPRVLPNRNAACPVHGNPLGSALGFPASEDFAAAQMRMTNFVMGFPPEAPWD